MSARTSGLVAMSSSDALATQALLARGGLPSNCRLRWILVTSASGSAGHPTAQGRHSLSRRQPHLVSRGCSALGDRRGNVREVPGHSSCAPRRLVLAPSNSRTSSGPRAGRSTHARIAPRRQVPPSNCSSLELLPPQVLSGVGCIGLCAPRSSIMLQVHAVPRLARAAIVSAQIIASAAALSAPKPQVGQVQPVWRAHPHLAAQFLPLLTRPLMAQGIFSLPLLGTNDVPLQASSARHLTHRGGCSLCVATSSSSSASRVSRRRSVGAAAHFRMKDAASFPPRPN